MCDVNFIDVLQIYYLWKLVNMTLKNMFGFGYKNQIANMISFNNISVDGTVPKKTKTLLYDN